MKEKSNTNKKKGVTPVTPKIAVKGSRVPQIIDLATKNPSLTPTQIGKMTDCTHVNVINTLKRYGISLDKTREYIDAKEWIESSLQERLLAGITDAEIKSMSVPQRVTSYAILEDKILQRSGRGHGNSANVQINIVADPRNVQVRDGNSAL